MNTQTANKIVKQTKDDYNRIALQFDSTRKYNWRDIAKVIGDLDIKSGSKILDLGCGGGRLYELLEKYEVDYTGVDNSEGLIELAKKKYPTAHFKVADISEYTPANKYDYIFCIAVLHHIPSKELRSRTIVSIKDSLTQKGTAVVSVWYFWKNLKYLKKIFVDFFSIRNPSLPFGDFYIPWKNQKGVTLAQRYHHAWTSRELKKYNFEIVSKDKNLIGIYKNL